MIIACELCVMEFLLLVQKLLLKTVTLWQSCLFLKCVCDVLNAARGVARDVRCFVFCVLGSVCKVLRRYKQPVREGWAEVRVLRSGPRFKDGARWEYCVLVTTLRCWRWPQGERPLLTSLTPLDLVSQELPIQVLTSSTLWSFSTQPGQICSTALLSVCLCDAL